VERLGDGWTKVNADFRRLNADCRRFTHHQFEICESLRPNLRPSAFPTPAD
jgi:hypothetical protein